MLKVNFTYEPTTLDPRRGRDVVTSTVHFMLYEGLMRVTATSTHELGLARHVDLSPDRLTYTFHLRNSKWSNGDPVTAHDFEYAWKSVLAPDFPCPNADLFYPIKNAEKAKRGDLPPSAVGVCALDDTTLEVVLESPCPYFLDLTAFCVFFPVPHKIVKNHPKWGDSLEPELVTNGPFRLAEWQKNDELLFKKNPTFWEKDKPRLDSIRVSLVSSELSALGMYLKDELDLLGYALTPIPADSILKFAKEGALRSQPLGASTYCSFNFKRPIFQNKHIRKAFAYAIDRASIIEHVTQFDELVATGCLPPVLNRGFLIHHFADANTTGALEHLLIGLKELGLTRGDLEGLSLTFYNNEIHKKVAQAIQQQWKAALGVEVKLEESEFKILMDRMNKKNFDISLNSWVTQYNDPMGILDRFKFEKNAKNFPGWEDPEYIRLLNLSTSAKTPDERFSILSQAERLITEEMPFSCIYHSNSVFMQKDRVKGFFISPIGSIHFHETYFD